MPEVSKINTGSAVYDLKDATARNLGNTMLKYTSQTLTSAQQSQARSNIGISKTGTLTYELVTTLIVICETGTSVTVSKSGLPSQTGVSSNGQCVFTLPNTENTLGYWNIVGTLSGVSASIDVDITKLGNVFRANLAEEWPYSEVSVTCPFGTVNITCANRDGSEVYTQTVTSGFYTFSLNTTGDWTFTMSATNHVDVVKTITVSVLGASYNLDMGEWPATKLTTNHPAGADVTCHIGTTYCYDYTLVNSTTTTFNTIEQTGDWTITASDLDSYHQPMVRTTTVNVIGTDVTLTTMPTTWDTVLIEVTHPSGASVSCAKAGTSIDGTTSGYTTRFYATSTGVWTITVDGTNHAQLTQEVTVNDMNANGYVADFDTVWPPAILTVTHPAGADVTCKSDTLTVFGDSVSTTKTQFEISRDSLVWTVTIKDIDMYHSDVSTEVSIPVVGNSYSTALTWTDILLEATVPGGTTTCTNTSTGATAALYKSYGTTRQFYVTGGTWKVETSDSAHTAKSATVSNVVVTNTTPYTVTINNGLWSDTTITVTHPAGAVLKFKNGSTTYTQTAGSTATTSTRKVSISGTWTVTALPSATAHEDLSGSVSVYEDFSNTPTLNLGTAWTKCSIWVNHPSGATVTCTTKPSSTTVTKTTGSTQDKFVVNKTGSYTFVVSASGHTALSFSTTVSAFGQIITIGATSWSDKYIWVSYSEGSTVTLTANGYVTTVNDTGTPSTNNGVVAKLLVPYNAECTVKASNGEYYNSNTVATSKFSSYTQSSPLELMFTIPSMYTELEYISASGGGYIDTGVVFNANMTISLKYALTSGAIGGTYCELSSGWGDETVWLAFPAIVSNQCNNFVGSSTGTSAPRSGTNSVSGSSLTGYGYGYLVRSLGYSLPTIYLFALNEIYESNGSWYTGKRTNPGTGKIYLMLIDEGSTTTHAYVACKIKNSTVCGFYDIVQDVFISGTGVSPGPIGSAF